MRDTDGRVMRERHTGRGPQLGGGGRENTHTHAKAGRDILLKQGKITVPQSDVSRLNLCCSEETSGVLIVNGRGWVCGQK